MGLLIVAAILGDNINYAVGRFFGERITNWTLFGKRLVRAKDLEKTHGYFERYGVRTIIIARFIPIVRTITPFVAGVGKMSYHNKFLPFDVLGGVAWITHTHYWPVSPSASTRSMQKNYEVIILGIVFISALLPDGDQVRPLPLRRQEKRGTPEGATFVPDGDMRRYGLIRPAARPQFQPGLLHGQDSGVKASTDLPLRPLRTRRTSPSSSGLCNATPGTSGGSTSPIPYKRLIIPFLARAGPRWPPPWAR